MTALAQGVQRPEISDPSFDFGPQKGSTIIYRNALIMTDSSGYLRPAAASVGSGAGYAGGYCVGVHDSPKADLDRSDATGLADGAISIGYKRGPFGFLNDGGSPILSTTPPGTTLFAVDDQTVSLSSSSGTRPVAGRLRGLDTSLVGGPVAVEVDKALNKTIADLLAIDSPVGFLAAADFRSIKNVQGRNGAGACTCTGAKVGDIVLVISFAKVPTAAAATQAGLTAFESTITVANQIQQTGAANLSAEFFDVVLISQS